MFYNDSTSANIAVGGQTIPALNVAVFVYPSTLTDAAKTNVASEIFARLGVVPTRYIPATSGVSGVRAEFASTTSEQVFVEGFWWMPTQEIGVRVTFADDGSDYDNGGYFDLVDETSKQAIRDYFSGLRAGDIVRVQEIIGVVVANPFAGRCVVEVSTDGGNTWLTTDIETDEVTFPIIDEDAFIVQEV